MSADLKFVVQQSGARLVQSRYGTSLPVNFTQPADTILIDGDSSLHAAVMPGNWSWNGDTPPTFTEVEVAQNSYLIDVGAFMDRFGLFKWAILASTDPVVQALVTDLSVRRWINVQHASIAAGMDVLIYKGLIDQNCKEAVCSTPAVLSENFALRHDYPELFQ